VVVLLSVLIEVDSRVMRIARVITSVTANSQCVVLVSEKINFANNVVISTNPLPHTKYDQFSMLDTQSMYLLSCRGRQYWS
jgi:hypothetical protein